MVLTQLSVKLTNKPGELSSISDIMGDEGINIKALSVAVHGEDAQVHLVVDDTKKAIEVFKSRDYQVAEREVLAVETPDHPGGLNAILRPLKEAGVNVEFLYPAIGKHQMKAVLILGPEPVEDAMTALHKYYIKVLDKELFGL